MNRTQNIYFLLSLLGFAAPTTLLFLGLSSSTHYAHILGLSGAVVVLAFYACISACTLILAEKEQEDRKNRMQELSQEKEQYFQDTAAQKKTELKERIKRGG